MILPVDPQRYLVFLGVMVVMAVTPGPANLFAIATGMEKGRRSAVVGVLGMNSATLCWFAAAALGLGALIAAFPQVFKVLTILGGVYVAWLGLRSLLAAIRGEAGPTHAIIRPGRSAFRDGFMVQATNPKALLFFTAVLPPFIDVHRPILAQLVLFACGVISLDLLAMTAYGIGGAALSARMSEPRFRRGFSVFVGVLLLTASGLILSRG